MPLAIAGESRGMSLLFPMERLFEAYVAAWMRKRLVSDARLVTQARTFSLCEHDGARMFQLRPDCWCTTRATVGWWTPSGSASMAVPAPKSTA